MNYPLLPYSQLVFDMQKTNAEVYTSEQVVRLNKEDVDIPYLQHAILFSQCMWMSMDDKAMNTYPISCMVNIMQWIS